MPPGSRTLSFNGYFTTEMSRGELSLGAVPADFLKWVQKLEGPAFFRFHFFANTSKGCLVSGVKTPLSIDQFKSTQMWCLDFKADQL